MSANRRAFLSALAMLNGKLYFCDAGIHPGWERDKSPHTGWVRRVDVI